LRSISTGKGCSGHCRLPPPFFYDRCGEDGKLVIGAS
jgi:hypothetical protein